MKVNKTIIALVGITLGLSSCYYHNWETLHPSGQGSVTPCKVDTTTVISYSIDVAPIVASRCAISGCHNSSGAGGDYSFYGTNSTGFYSVCRHDTSGSSAWQDITDESGNPMPQIGSPQLSSCEIATLRNWIHQGAANN